MTEIAKKVKNESQNFEAKMKTEKDHAEGKPSSETLNKAKVKVRDALTSKILKVFFCFHDHLHNLLAIFLLLVPGFFPYFHKNRAIMDCLVRKRE